MSTTLTQLNSYTGDNMTTRESLAVVRISGSHVQPQCSCGWSGVLYPIQTVEGWRIAERAANDHLYAHEHGLGWFDYTKGWVRP